MKNNIGWIVAFLLLLSRPALAEVNINITPWDLYAAARSIGCSWGGYDPGSCAKFATELCRLRPR